jgi:transposase
VDALAAERRVIERTFAWLSYMRRLAIRWERRAELYLALFTLGCAFVCWRQLAYCETTSKGTGRERGERSAGKAEPSAT